MWWVLVTITLIHDRKTLSKDTRVCWVRNLLVQRSLRPTFLYTLRRWLRFLGCVIITHVWISTILENLRIMHFSRLVPNRICLKIWCFDQRNSTLSKLSRIVEIWVVLVWMESHWSLHSSILLKCVSHSMTLISTGESEFFVF